MTAAGARILSTIMQTISRHLDQGHYPIAAVPLPQVHPVRGKTEPGEHVAYAEKVNLEMTSQQGWLIAVADALKTVGIEATSVERHASFGLVHLVTRIGDAWQGVADPDWEGSAGGTNCGPR